MKKTITIIVLITIFGVINGHSQPICSQTPLNPVYKATIYFPNYVYMGDHNNNCANGLGTLYYPDGSFYYGYFQNGFRHGSGVYVSRISGYSYGCFSNGYFVGAGTCFNWNQFWKGTSSQSDREMEVENLISEVQNQLPSSATKYDPSGYKVTEIDPNTEMGKTLLGGH